MKFKNSTYALIFVIAFSIIDQVVAQSVSAPNTNQIINIISHATDSDKNSGSPLINTPGAKGDDFNNDLYSIEEGGVSGEVDKNAQPGSTNTEIEKNIGGTSSNIETEKNIGGEEEKNNSNAGAATGNNSNIGNTSSETGNNNTDTGNSTQEHDKNQQQDNQNGQSDTGDNKNNDSSENDKNNPDDEGEKQNQEDSSNKNTSPHPDGEGGSNETDQRGIINPENIVKSSATKIREGSANKLNTVGIVNPGHAIGNDPKFDHTVGDGSGAIDPNQTGKEKISDGKISGKLNRGQFDKGNLVGKGLGVPASMQNKAPKSLSGQ